MRRSAELLARIHSILTSISPAGEPLDELSRGILIQIAEAEGRKHKTRVSDVITQHKPFTAPTVHIRLKRLVELGLVRAESCQQDGRSVLLMLTPDSQKMVEELAWNIRYACGR